jgi:hypothetical protein
MLLRQTIQTSANIQDISKPGISHKTKEPAIFSFSPPKVTDQYTQLVGRPHTLMTLLSRGHIQTLHESTQKM